VFNLATIAIGFSVLTQEELAEGAANGWPVFVALKNKLGSESLSVLGNLFSVFAILSSLFGVTSAMKGAFFDPCGKQKVLAMIVEFIVILTVPVTVAICCPGIFLSVLSFAGGILVNILAGLLPVLLYVKQKPTSWWHMLLIAIFAFVLYVEISKMISSISAKVSG
jgi:amino acid permease